MGGRFVFILIVAFAAATAIGVAAAKNQAAPAPVVVPTAAPTPVPTAAPNVVEIIPNPSDDSTGLFVPATVTVSVGQKVTWLNLDSKTHSIIADNGAFTTPVLGLNETASWVPTRSGTYTYSDFLHPDMHGTIIVK